MTILFGGFAMKPNGDLVRADGSKARVRAIGPKCIDPEDVKYIQPTLMKWLVENVWVIPQWANEYGATDTGLQLKLYKPGEKEVFINALDLALMLESYGEEETRKHYIPRLGSFGKN